MPLRFATFIFDCDGTLVDSERLGIEVIAEMAREHGAVFEIESALRQFRGVRMADCVARIEALRGSPLPDDFVMETRRRMGQRFRRDLKPIDGAQELLRSVSVPMCIASNGPREKMELTLGITGLLSYFGGRIFSAYEVGHWKPKPDLFLHAAQAMNVDAQGCAAVEDSEPGVTGALAAGMHVFALKNEHLQIERSEQITPIDSLWELRTLLLPSTY